MRNWKESRLFVLFEIKLYQFIRVEYFYRIYRGISSSPSSAGVVCDIDGMLIAQVLHKLGAGRSKAGDPVNHSVGAELLVSLDETVQTGETAMITITTAARTGV